MRVEHSMTLRIAADFVDTSAALPASLFAARTRLRLATHLEVVSVQSPHLVGLCRLVELHELNPLGNVLESHPQGEAKTSGARHDEPRVAVDGVADLADRRRDILGAQGSREGHDLLRIRIGEPITAPDEKKLRHALHPLSLASGLTP